MEETVKTIEQKVTRKAKSWATESCGYNPDGSEKLVVIKEEEEAFIAGAHYMRDAVWHDCSEQPKEGSLILLHMNSGMCKVIKYACDEVCLDGMFWIKISEQKEWAYLNELLPRHDE